MLGLILEHHGCSSPHALPYSISGLLKRYCHTSNPYYHTKESESWQLSMTSQMTQSTA